MPLEVTPNSKRRKWKRSRQSSTVAVNFPEQILRQNSSFCGSRVCFEECGCFCRLESVGSAVGDQLVPTATRFSPAADLPCRHTILREHQQHELPDIGPNGGLGPQGWQRLPFDFCHVLSL